MKNRVLTIIKNDFVQKVIETFAVRIFLILVGLITTVIVSRLFGPEGRGIYAVATALTMIGVQFGNLGLHASNTYYVAKDESILPKIIGNSIFISFVVGGFLSLLFYTIFINFPSISPIQENKILFIALISVPISLGYLLLSNILIGLHNVRAYNLLEILNKTFVLIVVGFIFFFMEVSIDKFLIAILIGNLLTLFVAKREFSKYISKIEYSFILFKEHIKYGFKAYLAAFFSFMVIRSDILMVDFYLGAEATGYYSIASTMAEMVYMLPTIIGMLLAPRVIRIVNQKEKWELTKKTVWLTAIIMIVLCLFAVFIAEYAVVLLFGEEFLPAVEPFKWLMPAVFFLSIYTVFQNFLASLGMPTIVIYLPLFGFLINVFMNILLIAKIGIVGASISSILAYFVMFVLCLIYLRRVYVKL